jgi:hypothetical protein
MAMLNNHKVDIFRVGCWWIDHMHQYAIICHIMTIIWWPCVGHFWVVPMSSKPCTRTSRTWCHVLFLSKLRVGFLDQIWNIWEYLSIPFSYYKNHMFFSLKCDEWTGSKKTSSPGLMLNLELVFVHQVGSLATGKWRTRVLLLEASTTAFDAMGS